ncbi:tetratricopeptide repeat protein [Solihabitans fulvus]|uniref:Tetratricopeptide repeat protein n=1 Tax=Solihabitans fulvus TaxID=1892852 RepID=A0A5B2X040_9PSEU|nr:tetratricopeptide repeat protein [Solihabitans fulvus]
MGPIEASGAGGRARLPGSRQLALLAALLLHADRVVPVDELVEAVWGDRPPGNAAAALQTYVFRLRRALSSIEPDGNQRLTFTSGYRLRVEPGELDLAEFREHVRRAGAAEDRPEEAAAELRSALALWRGAALTAVSGRYFAAQAARLAEERLTALEERFAADLARGQDAGLVEELRGLVATHPLRERLRRHLMLALYRSGGRAEALAAYEDLRGTLVDELGVDPGPELTELRDRLLRDEDAPPVEADRGRPGARNDLPGDIADFTGREEEMRRLLDALPAGGGSAVVIEAIDGMAGIGKTTLAVHAAHRLCDRYPDGQLFTDLHGHTSEHEATDPAAALDALLRALDVPGEQIPPRLDERAALWRAELAERKVLVVLDNAASAAQVRPLLPGASGCLVLVTSRRRLADLDTAGTLSLDVLSAAESAELFGRIVGRGPAEAEPEAVGEVVELCGRLPLAIRIAAARLRTRPAWTVAHLAGRLAQDYQRLTELATGDRSVAAAFALSYHHLDEDQQRLFRLLGLHPGADFDLHAAASLAGIGLDDAERQLEHLVDVHLLDQSVLGRYRFHDLLRQHALGVARTVESEARQREALRRLVDCCLHTAFAGDRLLFPPRQPIELDPPSPGSLPRPLADETSAMAWFDAEHAGLRSVQQLAAERGWHRAVWQLAWAMNTAHAWRGNGQDDLASWRAGLAAAGHLDDPACQILAHRRLGDANARVGRHAEALDHLQLALTLAERAGDQPGQAHAHQILAWSWERMGDDERALDHASRALLLFRALGNPVWEADALNAVGWFSARLGRYEPARASCEAALNLYRRHGFRIGEAATLDSLGYVEHHSGRHAEAVEHYQAALELYRDLGNSYEEADTLDRLGRTHTAVGDLARARAVWERARDLVRAQRRGGVADRIQRQLDELPD